MANRKNIVEDLSIALINENGKTYVREYRKHINDIQNEVITKAQKGIRPTIQSVKVKPNIRGININTRAAFLMAEIQNAVMNPAKATKGIKLLMELYSVDSPILLAAKLRKLAGRNLRVFPLNPRETKAFRLTNEILNANKKQIQALVERNTRALRVINKQITTDQSRVIIKRRNKLIRERIIENGVSRPLTNDEIAKRLKADFKNDTARVERILNTETHRQNELVKEVRARQQGFTHKTWNTQRDKKVRDSHKKLDGKRIPIGSKFNVGGHKASQPGDSTLPPHESINCRCFLTFD